MLGNTSLGHIIHFGSILFSLKSTYNVIGFLQQEQYCNTSWAFVSSFLSFGVNGMYFSYFSQENISKILSDFQNVRDQTTNMT